MLGFGNLFTVESAMFFGIGFLFACLIGIAVVSAVHERAVRLTTRRLDATIPLSVKEMQAEKDLLRGKFAAATVQLETSIETLRDKTVAQVSELGRKAELVNKLKIALDEKTATLAALEIREKTLAAREKELWDELHAARNDVSAKISALAEAERAMAVMRAEISSLTIAVEQRGHLIDSQYNEIAALTRRGEVQHARTMPAEVRTEPRAAAPAAAPAAVRQDVKNYEPRTTAEWLEFGKAKLRNGNGGAARVPYEKSANGVRPL